jgi:hypothetical protein
MWFFYLLPALVAVGFILVRISRGGSLAPSANWKQISLGLLGIAVLGALAATFVGQSR